MISYDKIDIGILHTMISDIHSHVNEEPEKDFRGYYGGDTMPALKPSSAVFLEMQERYHIEPLETYMVGDSPVDREFATNCGIPFIFAAYGCFTPEEEKKAISSDFTAHTTKDLFEIIKSLCNRDR